MTPNELRRFEAKVAPEPMSGCWLWAASDNGVGYGTMGRDGRYGGKALAHCLAYEHWREPVPPGLDLDHLCRVRCCVNPWHLCAVTRRGNLLAHGSMSAAKTLSERAVCLRGGHDRFRVRGDGTRYCLECRRLDEAARRVARKAATAA